MFGLGTTELIIIVLVILLLFGGKKIPELMKGLGQGVRSFKEGMNEVKANLDTDAPAKKSQSDSAPQATTTEEKPTETDTTKEA